MHAEHVTTGLVRLGEKNFITMSTDTVWPKLPADFVASVISSDFLQLQANGEEDAVAAAVLRWVEGQADGEEWGPLVVSEQARALWQHVRTPLLDPSSVASRQAAEAGLLSAEQRQEAALFRNDSAHRHQMLEMQLEQVRDGTQRGVTGR